MKKALAQLHAAVFLAGFTGILGKLIELNEGLLVGYRMLITAVSLGIWALLGKRLQRISLRDTLSLLGIGAVVALHWLFFYASIKYANVSVALTCFSATGFFTAFFEPLYNRGPIKWAEVLLGLLAIVGIYIIFDFHPQYQTGIAFGIAAALGSAVFPVLNKKMIDRVVPRTLTFYEMVGGVLLLAAILHLYLQAFPAAYYLPTPSDWGWLLVLSWLCTILCFELQLRALRHISAFTTNLTYNLEPIYGIVLAFLFLQENQTLNTGFYWGLGLILGAVVLQMVRMRVLRS
jgi:drug/metabolite transporter (DMT)-like permease